MLDRWPALNRRKYIYRDIFSQYDTKNCKRDCNNTASHLCIICTVHKQCTRKVTRTHKKITPHKERLWELSLYIGYKCTELNEQCWDLYFVSVQWHAWVVFIQELSWNFAWIHSVCLVEYLVIYYFYKSSCLTRTMIVTMISKITCHNMVNTAWKIMVSKKA